MPSKGADAAAILPKGTGGRQRPAERRESVRFLAQTRTGATGFIFAVKLERSACSATAAIAECAPVCESWGSQTPTGCAQRDHYDSKAARASASITVHLG